MIDKVSPYFLHYINLVPNFFKLILKKNYFLYHIHYQPLLYHTLKKKKKNKLCVPTSGENSKIHLSSNCNLSHINIRPLLPYATHHALSFFVDDEKQATQ